MRIEWKYAYENIFTVRYKRKGAIEERLIHGPIGIFLSHSTVRWVSDEEEVSGGISLCRMKVLHMYSKKEQNLLDRFQELTNDTDETLFMGAYVLLKPKKKGIHCGMLLFSCEKSYAVSHLF